MEDENLVVSRWSEPKGKEVSRKYYAITEKGCSLLTELNALWKNFSDQVSHILDD